VTASMAAEPPAEAPPTSALLAEIPAGLWRQARAAPARLLALDYDGTLAPFTVDPNEAHPLPEARRALQRVIRQGRTTVVILSGRPPDEVERLLGRLPVTVVGEHGWAIHYPDGGLLRHPLPPELADRLDSAAEQSERRAASARVERKRTSIVLHTRGLEAATARGAEERTRRSWERRHRSSGLSIRPVDGGLELRAPGHDKGTALSELAATLDAGACIVALGDDDTDEDAFRAARECNGWGILVGPPRATAARGRLESPAAVAAFLDAWHVELAAGVARRRASRG
jgi:trehalose 6-phosphate phosphatase